MAHDQPHQQFQYHSRLLGRRIRLFRINPGRCDEPLSLFLLEADIDGCRKTFTALSYVWSDPNDRCLASCNGKNVMLTRNLYLALWQMRKDGRQEYIWADAISINQNDEAEETEQVRMMGDIYQGAELVFIWLGPEEKNDRVGLSLVRTIVDMIKAYEHHDGSLTDYMTAKGLDDVPMESWIAMLAFIRKPWFWRVWVIQEHQLADRRVLQCGNIDVDLESLVDLEEALVKHLELSYFIHWHTYQHGHTFDYSCGPVIGVLASLTDNRDCLSLWKLIHLGRRLQSTEKKDRVFALVRLSSNFDNTLINYQTAYSTLLQR